MEGETPDVFHLDNTIKLQESRLPFRAQTLT